MENNETRKDITIAPTNSITAQDNNNPPYSIDDRYESIEQARLRDPLGPVVW